ncbi:Gfo/Idh/MocA family oxidoreductase [Sphingobacterium sp. UT-1RO-CII-1]|uniref:Gfo/Idh/MocA family protein n=1 Tax=Sphingobacterium sp. UT-1RO-CII-1 TaxID=2995225 RepID=UPI00227BD8EE|nr:Gfo/Idh/MocA family oxidoreductase [Sphingobacterium sp. UT-1RO-CII-1]MCY4779545.1 Gfo/Idh/MocA family oxidoreductase [Sphingobacterium sp. UT-1RO-CII-1]
MNSRRKFITQLSLVGGGLLLHNEITAQGIKGKVKKIGVIGLDTSHSEMFTKDINEGKLSDRGYRVVAAYPHGSKDIPSALQMKPNIIKAMEGMGVRIVDSITVLLKEVDYVLLESNDGRVHLEQAKEVIKAKKPLFIDKPMGQDLKNVEAIFKLAADNKVPLFSSSSLRYDAHVLQVKEGSVGKVLGADVYTYAELEPHHIDLAWYMIHGVEMLYTVMGTGCEKVIRTFSEGQELVTGYWKDGRIGSVRGIRTGANNIAGTVFGETGIVPIGPFDGYGPLVKEILDFFDTGVVPVQPEETLEIFKFMEAAQRSRFSGRYEYL